nr:hypothetical protein BaRGS_029823 [Batillaria attramentaria]
MRYHRYYPPGDNFTVSCQLYPGERLECCLVITDPRRLLDNPVPVTYSAEYGRVEAMEPFPEIWMDPDAGQKCVDYDLSEYDLSYLGTLMVRMNASNELGNRSSTVTFRPIDEVNPGHVTALQGHNLSNPNQIQITWSLAWSDIYPSTCKTMGGVYYDVIVKSLHPDVKQSMDKTFLDSNCTNRKMSYTATGLVPHTLYNITVTARSRTHRGQPASFNQTTSQGVPLVAPAVTALAYSDGDTSDTVAIYWSKYTHEEKGGDIISYDVIVNGTFVVVRVKDKLHTSDGQLVTTPSRPLSGLSFEKRT